MSLDQLFGPSTQAAVARGLSGLGALSLSLLSGGIFLLEGFQALERLFYFESLFFL